jgi:phenylpropionate dioxygenase-like ring-hydroxylating dioxygenase large terminal subunit
MDAINANSLQSVPFRVEDARKIPTERYFDEEFFRLETEMLWSRVWQMACRLEEIPDVGDFTQYTILNKSVIIVRTKSGVKAFHNACRHRGLRLVTEPGNCEIKGFNCPFHGWRWNMDGANTFVHDRQTFDDDILDAAEIALAPCRIDFWAGCAFISFDDDARSLRECLGPVADRLDARHVDRLKMDWWFGTVLPTNWKLAMEAFMDNFHVMRTHPQLYELSARLDDNSSGPGGARQLRNMTGREALEMSVDFMARLSSGMAGMVHQTEVAVIEKLRDMEIPDDPMAATGAFYQRAWTDIRDDALARGAPMFDIPKVAQEVEFNAVEFMFPHFFLLPFLGAMSSYRIRPLTAETCLFEIWSLVLRPEGEAYDTPKKPTMLPYDSADFPEIPRQDYSNLPLQQLGLHAETFKYMRLSKSEEGMISNYQRLIDGYLAGFDSEVLAKASRIVNCGNAGIIRDIGF